MVSIHNSLLSEPLFVNHNARELLGVNCKRNEGLLSLLGIVMPKEHPDASDVSLEVVADSLETYFRKMISSCALQVLIPAYDHSLWGSSKRIKSVLSPSVKKRLSFVDYRQSIWACIEDYLRCVHEELPISDSSNTKDALQNAFAFSNGKQTLQEELFRLAWDLYMLILAAKYQCEVPLDPEETRSCIVTLLKCESLSRESKARLSLVGGIFAAYSRKTDIPAFHVLPTATQRALRERLDELLEDAYLLEASSLKRFLSLKSNVTSIKRDLRKLIKFIVKNRKWAQGLLGAASQLGILSPNSTRPAEKLLEIIPTYNPEHGMPTLINPGSYRRAISGQMQLSSQRIPFFGRQTYRVTLLFEMNKGMFVDIGTLSK